MKLAATLINSIIPFLIGLEKESHRPNGGGFQP